MARQSKRKKFSNNQPVVFRFGERRLVGKVVFIRPIGKQFSYDVLCEDGKVYGELGVDSAINQCIDTYLTRLFYRKYKIDENSIPELIEEVVNIPESALSNAIIDDSESEESENIADEEERLFEDEDADPNY